MSRIGTEQRGPRIGIVTQKNLIHYKITNYFFQNVMRTTSHINLHLNYPPKTHANLYQKVNEWQPVALSLSTSNSKHVLNELSLSLYLL